jgi:uncharacterized membrane protein
VLWRGPAWKPATAFLVVGGLAGCAAAVLTGGILEGNQVPRLLERHELLGWLTLILAGISAGLLLLERRGIIPRWPILAALVVAAALVAATGHIGGQMSWGPDWL